MAIVLCLADVLPMPLVYEANVMGFTQEPSFDWCWTRVSQGLTALEVGKEPVKKSRRKPKLKEPSEQLRNSQVLKEPSNPSDPKPQTPNPKPQTPNPKPQTLNPKPYNGSGLSHGPLGVCLWRIRPLPGPAPHALLAGPMHSARRGLHRRRQHRSAGDQGFRV